MGEPGDGVGLSAPGTVLYEIFLANAVLLDIGKQALHHIQLMIAGENLLDGFLLRLRVGFLHHLCIVLNDTGEFSLGQYVLPKIIRHNAVRVGRIARTVFIAFVKGQEPACFPGQARTELDSGIVHGKMHHAPLKSKDGFSGVAVILVLFHGVIDVLLGELVL